MSTHRSRQKEQGEVEGTPERSPEIEIAAQDDWGFSGDDDHQDDRSYDRYEQGSKFRSESW